MGVKKIRKVLCLLGSAMLLSFSVSFFAACGETKKAGEFYFQFRKDNTITVFVEKYDMAELVIPESINGYRVAAIAAPKESDGINTTLINVVMPDTVQTIEDSAFRNCVGFIGLQFPQGLVCIEDSAFQGCSSLLALDLPEGVKEIGSHAFSDCSALHSVYLPAGVEEVGMYAFDGCPSLTIYSGRSSAPGIFSGWGYKWSGSATVHYGASRP